jgi:AraC-like DNA-binding protein
MHISINQYMKERKIQRAKILSCSSAQNVQDITKTLGSCNPSYFSESFRKIVGITPYKFRSKKDEQKKNTAK